MSIRENPTAFLNAENMPFALTADQLDLPMPEVAKHHQPVALAVGERYCIFSADKLRVGHYKVQKMYTDDRFGTITSLDNMASNSSICLSTSQIVFLEVHRRIRPHKGQSLNENAPGTGLLPTDAQQKKAMYYLRYIEAVFHYAESKGVRVRRRVIERAAALHAIATNDLCPPSYNTLRVKIAEYLNGSFDLLRAVAPRITKGNREDRFCHRIEALLADAVEEGWRLNSGDWRDVKKLFANALKDPKYQDLHALAFDEKGRLVSPSDRTIQRRFASVDYFTQMLWRHGPEFAQKHCNIYVRQVLPDHPLDVVDVDFTPIHVIVVDDERPIVYGRPHLLVFRDRKTGSILGKSISFIGPSFEAFVEGLLHAINPKDMSAYPGLDWMQYGTFLRLGVDNDMAFINDNVRETLSQLGIQMVEYRAGHPWEKGAEERIFRTLNQDVMHNLPHATMSNVVQRTDFKDRDEDLPMLTLSELDDLITDYICNVYHKTYHNGLGMLRTLDGVPNDLWQQGIHKASNRRPFDPDILLRMAGDYREVAVREGCVRWDNIIYSHPDLVAVRADSRNRTAVPGVETTLYKAVRDPSDLGSIRLFDHFNKRWIEVPARAADAWYAKGLRLYQHRKIMAHLREKKRDARDFEGAYDDFAKKLTTINEIRSSKRTRDQLAKFHARATKKYRRSRIVEIDHNDPSGSTHMQLVDDHSPSTADGKSAFDKPNSPEAGKPTVTSEPPQRPSIRQHVAAQKDDPTKKHNIDLSFDEDDISSLLSKKDDQ